MSDLCNQCAKELGLPEGDLKAGQDADVLEPGHGFVNLCEGCGVCLTDADGNCVDSHCLKEHGQK